MFQFNQSSEYIFCILLQRCILSGERFQVLTRCNGLIDYADSCVDTVPKSTNVPFPQLHIISVILLKSSCAVNSNCLCAAKLWKNRPHAHCTHKRPSLSQDTLYLRYPFMLRSLASTPAFPANQINQSVNAHKKNSANCIQCAHHTAAERTKKIDPNCIEKSISKWKESFCEKLSTERKNVCQFCRFFFSTFSIK